MHLFQRKRGKGKTPPRIVFGKDLSSLNEKKTMPAAAWKSGTGTDTTNGPTGDDT